MTIGTYIGSAVEQIGRAQSLAELTEITDLVDPALSDQLAAISAEVTKLAPFLALATASFSTLPQVVTFLTDLQTVVFGPVIAANTKLGVQVAEVTAGIAEVAAAVAEAEARIGS